MTRRTLWQVSVTTSREAEDAAAALLERLFGAPASIYAPDGQEVSTAAVYSSRTAKQVKSKRDALDAGLQFLARCQLDLGPSQVVIRQVPREDWTTSWRKSIKTIQVGSALLIRPSWSKRRPRPGQAVITLDPGLSFGTGQHPTTAFCLKQLVQARRMGQPQSFLDIGTGSGILAIAAVKLGYHPVRAIDNDSTAVRVAKANAKKNRVDQGMAIVRQDLTHWPKTTRVQYDLICANLVQDLLLEEATTILARLRKGGRLVLSGLLRSQFDAVQDAYTRAGLRLETVRTEGEWKSGSFTEAG